MSQKNCRSNLCTEVQSLDEQDKNLIALFNYLKNEKELYEDNEVMGKVLDRVVSFTESHLRRGQLFMEECGYTECEVYKSSQNNLLGKLELMQKEYYYGKKDIVLDIATLVNNWVTELVPTENKELARVA